MRALIPKLLLLFALLMAPGLAFAQTGFIAGQVTDGETGGPLPGANVLVVDLNRGTASDVQGQYRVENVPVGTHTLRFTFVGYKEIERSVNVQAGQNVVSVSLQPDYTGLEEVVVTGIASQTSKARAEVSVSRVDASEYLEKTTYQDVSQLLNGKVAGVSVQPSSGNVGGGIRFNVRSGGGLNGDGQPVIYIDGVRIDNAEIGGFGVGGQGVSMLANLNPEDIASIDVLKGPAGAALYGTSGSNGVVLITTKRGRLAAGGIAPLAVSYKAVVGSNQQAVEYDSLMSPTPDVINSFFRDGAIWQHNVSLSGGSDLVRYYAAYDIRSEQGAIRNNEMDRQSFRANFEAFPFENITIKANTSFTENDINRPQNDNNIYGYLGNSMLAGSPFIFTDSASIEGVVNVQRINNFVASAELNYTPISNLQLRAAVGYDGSDLRNDETFPSNLSYATVNNGLRQIYARRNQQLTYDLNGRYAYTITPGLRATTIAGMQAFNRILRTFFVSKEQFQTELISNLGAGGEFLSGDEGFTHIREAGVYGQQELNYQDTYFLTLGLRRDFATAIGADAPNIFYPKASLAVRMDKFDFVPSALNFLKVRAAYGETGQLPGVLDASGLRWAAEPSGYGAGSVLSFIGNSAIKPERVKELEGGVDFELFNNIGIEATVYRQSAAESIIDFRNAPSTGLTVTGKPFNVGEVQGWGFEGSLSATPVRMQNFAFDFNVIYSYQDNEVKDLGGAQPIFDAFDNNVIKEGLPRSAFYVYSSVARFDDAGKYIGNAPGACQDADENPVDCSAAGASPARQFLGTPVPIHNGSVSLNFRAMRNLNVYVLADWATGMRVLNYTANFQARFGANARRNNLAAQLGLREIPGIDALEVGSAEYRAAAEAYAGTATSVNGVSTNGNYIEDADYFKLREISVSYDFTDLINRVSARNPVRNLTFALSARNLWTTSKYSGADPEVNARGARDLTRGWDFLTLPNPRSLYGTITIGL